MKSMLYITTHMSEQHVWYLMSCWPGALKHSLLLNSSDVAITSILQRTDRRTKPAEYHNSEQQLSQAVQMMHHKITSSLNHTRDFPTSEPYNTEVTP